MKAPVILILAAIALILIVGGVHHYAASFPYPELVSELCPEVRLVAFVALAAGFLGLLMDHNVERFEPLVKDGFTKISGDLREGIEGSLKTLNATMTTGFGEMATAFAKEAQRASEAIWKGFSDVRIEKQLISKIQTPKLRKLVDENRIQDAIAELDTFYAKDMAERQQKVSLLLLSNDEKDWNTALTMLDEDEGLLKPEYFISLAFRFWSVKKVEVAISLAERGMQRTNDERLLARFRNSLAYYYADADIASKESKAREYAESALQARPNDPGPLDTLGFVKITYAKTKEEISEGIKLCTHAFELGTRFELYAKDIEKATIRLKHFPPATP